MEYETDRKNCLWARIYKARGFFAGMGRAFLIQRLILTDCQYENGSSQTGLVMSREPRPHNAYPGFCITRCVTIRMLRQPAAGYLFV